LGGNDAGEDEDAGADAEEGEGARAERASESAMFGVGAEGGDGFAGREGHGGGSGASVCVIVCRFVYNNAQSNGARRGGKTAPEALAPHGAVYSR
jgi:hypothetical protein